MYSMMSKHEMYAVPAAVCAKYNSQGMAVNGGNPEMTALFQRRSNQTNRFKHPQTRGSGGPYRGNPTHRGSNFPGGSGPHQSPTAGTSPIHQTTVPSEESTSAAEVATSDPTSVTSAAAVEQPDGQQMANTKEKTPMCLINELARFNKVQHQYCLTDEQGPAHKKTFFVKLKLGEEEFLASGASIKKAQHAAAAVALEQTKLQHPPLKQRPAGATAVMPSKPGNGNSSVTPTVELNALAMKRGELAVYRPVERKPTTTATVTPPFYNAPFEYRGGFPNQRYRYPKPTHRFFVALKVGEREFIGEGETMQAARHNAATMALKLLQTLPMPSREPIIESKSLEGTAEENPSGKAVNESLKSEISLVHEIALKRNYTVEFEIVKESGPPHMRTFVTRCKCGPLVTDSEGSSKKLSKKFSAERMVAELRKLPALPPAPPSAKPKKNVTKPKQSKNLIKNVAGLSTVGVNPISRLIQIQQAKKEKEPTFSLVAENGAPRSREFVVQVTVGENVCSGVGPNKKLAKRNAAEQMLQLLGYSLTPPPPTKPALKAATTSESTAPSTVTPSVVTSPDKRVTFVDHEPDIVPCAARTAVITTVNGDQKLNTETTNKGVTVATSQSTASSSPTQPVPCPVRTFDQLAYLGKVMGFEIQISNFPKDNSKSEFLAMVTLCTNPPQFYNGCGPTVESAIDTAALAAIHKLSEVGFDSAVGSNNSPGGQTTTSPAARSARPRPDRPVISTVVSVKKEIK